VRELVSFTACKANNHKKDKHLQQCIGSREANPDVILRELQEGVQVNLYIHWLIISEVLWSNSRNVERAADVEGGHEEQSPPRLLQDKPRQEHGGGFYCSISQMRIYLDTFTFRGFGRRFYPKQLTRTVVYKDQNRSDFKNS